MKNNSKKLRMMVVASAFVAVTAVVALVLVNIFGTKETYSAPENTTTTISALSCKSTSPKNPFFTDDVANQEVHEVKATFSDGVVDKMSFTYTGDYPDDKTTTKASSELHAKYNLYMDKTSINFNALSPNFSTLGNQLIISLFFDTSKITSETAQLLFLTVDEAMNIKKSSMDDLRKSYQNKGFVCNNI